MKTVTIEQVTNGFIVSRKPPFSPCVEKHDTGILVFESLAAMSDWLHGHFTGDWEDDAIKSVHLGTDEL